MTKGNLLNTIKKLGGQINENKTIIEYSFNAEVSNDGGESITLDSAIEIEKQMMDLGFDGALLGSELDESDLTVIRFELI